MADNVPITAGSGVVIGTRDVSGTHHQLVWPSAVTAVTHDAWTIATTAVTSRIAANTDRLSVLMVSVAATGRVWLRFDNVAPTSTVYHWYLDPDDRYEVPPGLVTSAISVLGQTAAGTLITTLGTAV